MYEDLLKMVFFDKSFDLGLALNIGIFCMFGSFKDPTQCATGKKDHEQREKSIDIDWERGSLATDSPAEVCGVEKVIFKTTGVL